VFSTDDASPAYITDGGFDLVEGSIRVDPATFQAKAPHGFLIPVIVEALATAAADDGSLLDFDIRAFYDEHVTEAMGRNPDDPPLRYDAFTAMTLMEAFTWLREGGFLAHRGKGDSYDYWLAAPAG
jgi:hypothetical protein